MNKVRLQILFLLLVLSLFSCDLLFMNPLEVSSWTPQNENPNSISETKVTIEFSVKVNKIKAEKAFSLRIDNVIQEGKLNWESDRKLSFTPYEPLGSGNRHEIRVEQSCEDLYGNSLKRPFSFVFHRNSEQERPYIISTFPEDKDSLDNTNTTISISFSEAMNKLSVIDGLSFSPNITAAYNWNNNILNIIPYTPLKYEEYKLKLTSSILDLNGNDLGIEYNFSFTIGTDDILPEISNAGNSDLSITFTAADNAFLNTSSGLESNSEIRIVFSEEVSTESLSGKINFTPPIKFSLKDDDSEYLSDIELEFDEDFKHGERYQLSIEDDYLDREGNKGEGLKYYFDVDGALTTPPEIAKILLYKNPAGSKTNLADYEEQYRLENGSSIEDNSSINLENFSSDTDTFFDIYLRVSDKGNQDLDLLRLSFINNFFLSATNSSVTITPLMVEITPTDVSIAAEIDEIIIRYHCSLDTNGSGIFEINFDENFHDGKNIIIKESLVIRKNQ